MKPSNLELPTSNQPVPVLPGLPASKLTCLHRGSVAGEKQHPRNHAPIPTGLPVALSTGIRVSLSPGTLAPPKMVGHPLSRSRLNTRSPVSLFPGSLVSLYPVPFPRYETVHGHTCSLVSMSTGLYLSNGKDPRPYPLFPLSLTTLAACRARANRTDRGPLTYLLPCIPVYLLPCS